MAPTVRTNPCWERTLVELRRRLSPAQVETWFTPLVPLELTNVRARIGCPNRFYQTWLAEHYRSSLKEALAVAGLAVQRIEFELLVDRPPPGDAEPLPTVLELDPDSTFTRFVVGPGNKLAYEAAQAVVREPGGRYNPLLICGEVGSGKTHLLHAIGHALLTQQPHLRIRQLSAARLFELLVDAIERNRTAEFRSELRSADVLLMDDVHTLAGREGAQEEFFHSFNALYTAGKQLVATSRVPPSALHGVAERIRSRLAWGLVVELEPGDWAFRLDLAQAATEWLQWPLPLELLRNFVQPLEVSNRELLGLLLRAAATSKLTGEKPETILSQMLTEKQARSRSISIEEVIQAASQRLGLSPREVRGPRRAHALSRARQLVAYVAHRSAGFSLPTIGQALGGRDHTTILYSVRKAETLLSQDPEFARTLRALRRELNL